MSFTTWKYCVNFFWLPRFWRELLCNLNWDCSINNIPIISACQFPANVGDTGDIGSISGQEDPMEYEMATHFNIFAWRIPWTEEPGGLQSRAAKSWTRLSTHMHACVFSFFLFFLLLFKDLMMVCPVWDGLWFVLFGVHLKSWIYKFVCCQIWEIINNCSFK